jgi:hypothetical protein
MHVQYIHEAWTSPSPEYGYRQKDSLRSYRTCSSIAIGAPSACAYVSVSSCLHTLPVKTEWRLGLGCRVMSAGFQYRSINVQFSSLTNPGNPGLWVMTAFWISIRLLSWAYSVSCMGERSWIASRHKAGRNPATALKVQAAWTACGGGIWLIMKFWPWPRVYWVMSLKVIWRPSLLVLGGGEGLGKEN